MHTGVSRFMPAKFLTLRARSGKLDVYGLLHTGLHSPAADSSLYAHHVFKAFDQDDKGTISFQVN